jgi:hypothetical protein
MSVVKSHNYAFDPSLLRADDSFENAIFENADQEQQAVEAQQASRGREDNGHIEDFQKIAFDSVSGTPNQSCISMISWWRPETLSLAGTNDGTSVTIWQDAGLLRQTYSLFQQDVDSAPVWRLNMCNSMPAIEFTGRHCMEATIDSLRPISVSGEKVTSNTHLFDMTLFLVAKCGATHCKSPWPLFSISSGSASADVFGLVVNYSSEDSGAPRPAWNISLLGLSAAAVSNADNPEMWHVIVVRMSDGRCELCVDGMEIEADAEVAVSPEMVAAAGELGPKYRVCVGYSPCVDSFFDGDMCECIFYQAALDDRDCKLIGKYLATKYRLPFEFYDAAQRYQRKCDVEKLTQQTRTTISGVITAKAKFLRKKKLADRKESLHTKSQTVISAQRVLGSMKVSAALSMKGRQVSSKSEVVALVERLGKADFLMSSLNSLSELCELEEHRRTALGVGIIVRIADVMLSSNYSVRALACVVVSRVVQCDHVAQSQAISSGLLSNVLHNCLPLTPLPVLKSALMCISALIADYPPAADFVMIRVATAAELDLERQRFRIATEPSRLSKKLQSDTRNDFGIQAAHALHIVASNVPIPKVILSFVKLHGGKFVIPEPVMVAAVRVIANLTCCRAGTKYFLQVCCMLLCAVSVQSFFGQNGLFDVLFDILTSASDTGLICECLRAVASASKWDNLVVVLNCINFFFFANRVFMFEFKFDICGVF